MRISRLSRALLALGLAACSFHALAQVGSGSIALGAGGAGEAFDTLAASGEGTALPSGWYFREGGGTTTTTYQADNGSLNVGNVFSYGTTAATERAFGALGGNNLGSSGSVVADVGARITNQTGALLSSLPVSFTGELWKLQVVNVDRLTFEYSSDATSLTTGTWTAFPALDFATPATATGIGAKDGNVAPNRTAVSATLTGLSIANGSDLWVRWRETNISGNDNGLAIDDVFFGTATDVPPQLATSSPTAGATGVAVNSVIVLNFSEAVTATDPWFALSCGGNAVIANASGSGASRTLTPSGALPFGTSCSVELTETNIVDNDGSADALIAGAGYTDFSFTTVVDNAPTVLSTMPAHNATGVAASSNIAITFSEPVTLPALASDWLTLECGGGGLAGSVSGAGANWTFDPAATLPPGTACSFTLTAANIVDQDGIAHPLAGQVLFVFAVAADVAPTIQSTFPLDGAVNVAVGSTLTVTFSEAVTVTPAAFVIECPSGTVIAHTVSSGNQTSFTLDPTADLPADIDCTLAIDRTQISDIDGNADLLVAGAIIDFTTSAGLAGYYARVDASSCRTLRATLHGVIDDHYPVVYSDSDNAWMPGDASSYDVWEVLNQADEDPLDPSKILDIYRNESYTKIAGGNAIYNREHVWPNSHGFNDVLTVDGQPNPSYTDTHMLMASNTVYNANRGSRAFGTCNASCDIDVTIFNASSGDGGGPTSYPTGGGIPDHNWYTPGVDGGNGTHEVWDFRRGDLARGMLYMDVRYEGGTNARTGQRETDLILTDTRADIIGTPSGAFQTIGHSGLLTPLVAWAQGDQPTPREGLRNDVIESVQRNRNPFVDHPEWIALAFPNINPTPQPCLGPVVVAVDDDFTLAQDTTLTGAAPGVLRDDHNAASKNGQGLSATLVVPAANGVATITNAATGAFTYTPTAGFCGSDSFTYQASNGSATDQGIVHLDVACPAGSIAPTAVDDNANVTEDSGANVIAVIANDTDPDGGPKVVQSVTQPAGGATVGVAAVGAGGANVTFAPAADVCAATSFTYTLNGGSTATVTVAMTCSNDAPVASDATFVLDENSVAATVVGQVVASDIDAGATLGYAITAGNAAGAFSISASGEITVANAAPLDFEVTPSFVLSVTVTDNAAATDTATITINLANIDEGAAVANNDVATVTEDAIAAPIAVLVNDTPDPDGGALVVTGVGTADHGSVTFDAGGIAYTPMADYCGDDSVSYTVSGGDAARVDITVTCGNDAPTAPGTLVDQGAQEDIAIAPFGVAGAFNDIDAGDDLDFSQAGLPAGLVIDAETGSISGTPAAGSAGASPYTVTITATDGSGATAQATFEYTIVATAIFANGFEP